MRNKLMKIIDTKLSGVKIIRFNEFYDQRGVFFELFNFKEMELNFEIKQVNHSKSLKKHTFRGFHFQNPPYDQSKIVYCNRGHLLDFIIDINPYSTSYLSHISIELKESEYQSIYIPSGYAHGFLTLEDDTEITYFTNQYYSREHEVTIRYDDRSIAVNLKRFEPLIISDKDLNGIYLGADN
jgi:dTDP-4-dehydrorhamnose 3,5-epimerase